jgi:benzoate-CoA ligase family protein
MSGQGQPDVSAPFNASTWLLDRWVDAGSGDRTAVRVEGRSVSYADLLERTCAVASGLRGLGTRPEERVFIAMFNSAELVAAILGAMRMGAIPTLANVLLPASDLASVARDARATVAIVDPRVAGQGFSELVAELRITVVAGDGTLTGSQDDGDPYSTVEDSPGFWLCTSGSTGMPKLAMHRHVDIRHSFETYARGVLDITADDRVFSVAPISHAYGLGASITFPLGAGAVSIVDPAFPMPPPRISELAAEEKPTFFFAAPGAYAALSAAELPDDSFASVRYAVSAAEALPAEIWRRFRDRYGVEILDGVGSTEATHIFLSNKPGDIEPGTVGTIVPGFEARLVDESGAPVPDDEPGRLFIKGEGIATGYWCQAALSRETFQGEWVHTGDMYSRSPAGRYTYLGRSNDMFKASGEWVSPAEVEAVLTEHPGVLEAAVVGEPDDAGLVRPAAYVRLVVDTAESELLEWCRPRLAGFKRPRRVTVVDELPKTLTGKIQRYRLRS